MKYRSMIPALLATAMLVTDRPALAQEGYPEGTVAREGQRSVEIGNGLRWPLPDRHPSALRALTGKLTIYQVNIRQFTPEGTFDAFREQHLDRLHEMGVGMLWLMPIHPIGEVKRKGTMGSPYSVQNHQTVNPDLGTIEDLQELVEAAHERGMLVILDWVPNHSAWDHVESVVYPEWWVKDPETGLHKTPNEDWTDVIQFDHRRFPVRNYLQQSKDYWITEADIDGFRVDVAEMMEYSMQRRWIATLEYKYGEKFFLAEGYEDDLYRARYDTTYDWPFRDLLKGIVERRANIHQIYPTLFLMQKEASNGRFRMLFTSNHDMNAWENSAIDTFGDAAGIMAALTFLAQGMPMIYSGQEAGNDKELEFFEKDPIEWREHELAKIYRGLAHLKRNNSVLSHTTRGGVLKPIDCGEQDQVMGFRRERGTSVVAFIGNFTAEPASVTIGRDLGRATYRDAITGETVQARPGMTFDLEPWGFRVLFSGPVLPYPKNPLDPDNLVDREAQITR
ncbi:MAG: alpha-amylase family glycosyl hydrolase [Planctomycetota bacterium]